MPIRLQLEQLFLKAGVYIKFEIHIPPPFFLSSIFSKYEIYNKDGMRASGETFLAYFPM